MCPLLDYPDNGNVLRKTKQFVRANGRGGGGVYPRSLEILFQLLDAIEAGIPSRLKFRGDQSIFGIDSVVPPCCKPGLIPCLLKLHAERLKPILAPPINLLDGFERCIDRMRLHDLEYGSRDRLLRPSATKGNK